MKANIYNNLAVPPFKRKYGHIYDSQDSCVIVCGDGDPCALYSEKNTDPHFMCPKCGRLQLRMIEATPAQCGMEEQP